MNQRNTYNSIPLRNYFITILCLASLTGISQSSFSIDIDQKGLLKELSISGPTIATDTLDLIVQLRKTVKQLHDKGYLAANIAGIERIDSIYQVKLDSGGQYLWMEINPGNVPIEFLESSGFNPVFLKKKVIHYPELSALMHAIIDVYANNGHPFASIRLDSIQFEGTNVSAVLKLEKNKEFRFDSINIISTTQISTVYLQNLLEIEKGKLYDQSKIAQLSKKLKSVPFLQLEESPSINFKGNKVIVNLKLKAKKSSRFDFLIGIVPNNNGQNKVRITGDLQASLYNKLGQGEFASFRYKNYLNDQQELTLKLNYPFLFNLPFGINSSFDLFRNAAENRDIDFDIGIQYHFKNFSNVKIFWKNASSRLIEINAAQILETKKLPENLDVRLNGIGVALEASTLNYPYNPRSGFKLSVEGTGGLKKVIPNLEILSLNNELINFSDAYDTIRSGYQFSLSTYYEHFVPIGRIIALKLANASGFKIAEFQLFLNESYRIGGSKILRGFDEESIFVKSYSVFTIESRLLISTNSYFFVFGDYGFLQRNKTNSNDWDRPFSIGAGLSFDTGSGILLVSAAIGSQMQLPLDFNSSKIHVGYVSLF